MLEKIAEIDEYPTPCQDKEHYPPRMIAPKPGVYKHTCPACGESKVIRIHSYWR